jgi:transcriptional regulator with XRE-family HTH domain
METLFGDQLRKLREQQKLLQRQVASHLEIDTPMFSKIERGERKAKREQVELLAELLHADKIQLISLWLADQVFDLIRDEPQAKEVIELVKKEIRKHEH